MFGKEQAEFYRRNGYVLIEGLLEPPEVERLRREADAALDRMNAARMDTNKLWKGEWLGDEERRTQRLDAIHDMQFQAAAFTELLLNSRLLDAVEWLIGPNIQLHHTKLLAKPPHKGGAFPMHQDYPYFPHERHSMMAVSIYLDDATMENGCICVYPGSHKLGPLPCDPGGFYLPPAQYPIEKAVPVPARAGDAVAFNYLTIHGSAPNRSSRPRRNILIQMRDPADRPTNEFHQSRGQGMMLRGINPLPFGAAWENAQPAGAGGR
ncbi:MAG: phytanoyl-CoA dioxygenase family protein [Candidatus Sumerlaeia bacterium]